LVRVCGALGRRIKVRLAAPIAASPGRDDPAERPEMVPTSRDGLA
jgi:hypothetical protein